MHKEELLLVEWVDSACKASWQDRREAAKSVTLHCTTVGMLLHQDDERIVIAASCSHEDHTSVSDVTIIPMRCVDRIQALSEAKEVAPPPHRRAP